MSDAPVQEGPKKAVNDVEVGMPALLYLEEFGVQVWHAFGHMPYLVGSAIRNKDWRDIDVRLILPDEAYDALFDTAVTKLPERANGKWTAFCLAFSALGARMTGLPIDFQIQRRSWADARYGENSRRRLGMVERLIARQNGDGNGTVGL